MKNNDIFAGIEPGPGRWWKVELETNRVVSRNPIKVSLMETAVEGKLKMSTTIGYERTIAEASKIREAADSIIAKVGAYKQFVGNYPELAS